MSVSSLRFEEIVIRILQSTEASWEGKPGSFTQRPDDSTIRSYDAFVYTDVEVPFLAHAQGPPPGQPATFLSKPLAAVEHLQVRWSRYEEYLADFVEGDKPAEQMRSKLLGALSPGLEQLFGGQPLSDRPTRIRWLNETPELEDLPWELLVQGRRSQLLQQISFVRGLPPETPLPPVQVIQDHPLRVALLQDPSSDLPPLENIIPQHTRLQFFPLHGLPRKALQRVVSEGFEVLHIIADGRVSLAYEGILKFPTTDDSLPESDFLIPPSELSVLLRGSRVAVICLSPPGRLATPQSVRIAGHLVPSVYRAFAFLGATRQPLPSIVAALGPFEDWESHRFWQGFYTGLAETFNVEEAMFRGQSGGVTPMALFLRAPHGHFFRHVGPTETTAQEDPSQLGAQLQVSRDIVEQLTRLKDSFGGLPESVGSYLTIEQGRQERIVKELARWTISEEG